jgi:hypothetical protein
VKGRKTQLFKARKISQGIVLIEIDFSGAENTQNDIEAIQFFFVILHSL